MATLLAIALVIPRGVAAQQLDVIRGQVTAEDDEPIENANVTATSVSGGVNRSARTDRNGRFTITFPGGEGDYFVTVASLGYTPRRFEVRRTADQDILVADVTLSRMVLLDTVRAVAARDRVNPNERTPDVSGTELSASAAAVPADQQGDLNAIAGTIPGVTPILGAEGDPAGFSVLGLSADQNSVTLNGADFGSTTLPRDAQVSTSLVTAPYDVSRGGFSGAQLNVRSGSGSNYIRRQTSLVFDAPRSSGPIPRRAPSASATRISRSAARSPDRSSMTRRSTASRISSAGARTICAPCSTPIPPAPRPPASPRIRSRGSSPSRRPRASPSAPASHPRIGSAIRARSSAASTSPRPPRRPARRTSSCSTATGTARPPRRISPRSSPRTAAIARAGVPAHSSSTLPT
jgi:hypothetical protein